MRNYNSPMNRNLYSCILEMDVLNYAKVIV